MHWYGDVTLCRSDGLSYEEHIHCWNGYSDWPHDDVSCLLAYLDTNGLPIGKCPMIQRLHTWVSFNSPAFLHSILSTRARQLNYMFHLIEIARSFWFSGTHLQPIHQHWNTFSTNQSHAFPLHLLPSLICNIGSPTHKIPFNILLISRADTGLHVLIYHFIFLAYLHFLCTPSVLLWPVYNAIQSHPFHWLVAYSPDLSLSEHWTSCMHKMVFELPTNYIHYMWRLRL